MKYHNIEELSKDDFKWRKMALKIAKCSIIADEIVGEFYFKYLSAKPKTINENYISISLERIYHLMYKRYEYTEYFDITPDNSIEYNYELDEHNQTMYETILDELHNIHWFHRMIFKFVMVDGISIRELSRRTTIPFNVLRYSIVDTKEYLKNKFQDDYHSHGSGIKRITDDE